MLPCLHHGWPLRLCYFITHPQITKGPSSKPCKVSNMTLTKFVRCRGPCPRESYGVCPWAQANIPYLGTSGRRLFYYKPQSPSSLLSWPQAQAHSLHGLKPKLTPFMAFLELCRNSLTPWSLIELLDCQLVKTCWVLTFARGAYLL
jgi:hypothetical protein